jgi:error-prone DNA polymerase
MGFYRPSVIVNDAKRHGLQVFPVHINTSCGRCMPEGTGFRLGFNYVRGMGETLIERLLIARNDGPFTGLERFCQRTRLPVRIVENLIQAGAMAEWGISQRDLIWLLGTIHYTADDELDLPMEPVEVDLPDLTHAEQLDMEYRALGLSTGQHAMVYYREWLDAHDILSSAGIERAQPNGTVRVAGLMIVRQAPPTAKRFHFITLEDEFGFINVIVRPQIYQRFRRVIRSTPLLVVTGKVQVEQRVLNLIATGFQALPPVV